MGISRDKLHKRRATGGRRKLLRGKRKYELGRAPALTKLGDKRIHLVRTRGGHCKRRALRLNEGHFIWPGEAATKRSRILNVVYNATSNELVRTNTLVKGAIVQIDATPFKQWYEQFYRVQLGKKKEEPKEGEDKTKIKKSEKKSVATSKKDETKSAEKKPEKTSESKQGQPEKKDEKGGKKAEKSKEQKAEKKAEKKSEKKSEKKEEKKAEQPNKPQTKEEQKKALKELRERRKKAEEIKKAIDSGIRKPSKHLRRKINSRNKLRVLEQALKDQFNTGRILARISSRPGQSGRADGYILEGEELSFYLRKIEKKKKDWA